MFFKITSVNIRRHLEIARQQQMKWVLLVLRNDRVFGRFRGRMLKIREPLTISATIIHIVGGRGREGGLGNPAVGDVDPPKG